MANKKRTFRERICVDCGRVQSVRSDNRAIRCTSCTSRIAIQPLLAQIKARPRFLADCPQCGMQFRTTRAAADRAAVHCCSKACRKLFCGIQRNCKFCGIQFRALKSQVKGIARSNSSANFCSRECYEHWLCKPNRVTGRGSRWHAIRRRAVAKAPFCARCGTTRRLDVHHIVPFRMTHDNRQTNLIPLCKRCHKYVESMLNDVVLTGLAPSMILLAFGSLLRDLQLATLMKLRALQRLNG